MADTTYPAGTTVNQSGYHTFRLGGFEFERDEYFVHVRWPGGSHIAHADRFLRALMRDVAWNFFYGTINFDEVFGTTNHYGTVEVYAGLYNDGYRARGKHHVETHQGDEVRALFSAMLEDWTNEGFDPFAAPEETGTPFGRKHGRNSRALSRVRVGRSGWSGSRATLRCAATRAGRR